MKQKLIALYYRLKHRLNPGSVPVRCRTCPNWRFHGTVKAQRPVLKPDGKLAMENDLWRVGTCALDAPMVFAGSALGFGLRAWARDDTCARHPLYNPKLIIGDDLEYRPGELTTNAGFNRIPSLEEAVKLSRLREGLVNAAGKRFDFKMGSADNSKAPEQNADNEKP